MHDRDILRTLAARLPEDFLKKCFPGEDTERIREILRRLGSPPDGESTAGSPAAAPGDHPCRLKQGGGRCILYTDGASRGNPGESGAGVVLLDETQNELAARSLYLGQCTNNEAEYRALIAGLELAVQLGCGRLDIRMDSELIVRQISGRYKVNNAQLKILYQRVIELLGTMEEWRIRHVPRNDNARADQLANLGIDEHKAG